MTDPLRVPEAVREAVPEVLRFLGYDSTALCLDKSEIDAIARAVLAAAIKAEWPGPWEVWANELGEVGVRRRGAKYRDSISLPGECTEVQARAVAAALNITQGGER